MKKPHVRLAGMVALLTGAVLHAGQTPPPAAGTQTPTFKAEVEYVEVDVLVTDQQGQFVRDLKKEDFQVLEDGKPQTVTTFSLVDIPVERAEKPLFATRPIDPDVQSNERPFDGRVYVMILDDLHTNALRTQLVKNAARQFIERNLGANDLMAVVYTGGRADAAQEFTRSKRLLLDSVDKFMGQKLQSATLARNDEFFRRPPGSGTIIDPNDQERAYNARSTLRSLKQVAEWFGGVRGRRKTILFVSEGIDYDITDIIRQYDLPASSASAIIDDIRETIAATARSNVSIYGIDPRGLTTMGDDTIGVGSFADGSSTSSNTGDPAPTTSSGTGGRPNTMGLSSLNNELRLSQDNLRALSDESGGFAVVNSNDFSTAFDRIVRDNSSYYVLAYYPPSSKRDGKFHRISVRVPGRPGLTVRNRRGYAAPRGRPPAPRKPGSSGGATPEVLEAMNSPIQVSGLGMRAFAAPFKGAAPNGSVLIGVELNGRDLQLGPNSRVEVSFLAVDGKGKIQDGGTDKYTLNLKPETRTRVEQTGFRVLKRMNLPPGRYQVRIGTHDTSSGAVGSIIQDLDVPEFSKLPFSMSGVLLTSMSSAVIITAKPDEETRAVLPAPPIATRTFPQNDELALFAEIYDNQGARPHRVDITTTVTSDTGTVVYKTEESRESKEMEGARGGYGYTTRIPLTEVAPGLYVLTVEARTRLGNEVVASRQVQFEVTPRTAP